MPPALRASQLSSVYRTVPWVGPNARLGRPPSPLFAADLVLSVARAERLASFLNGRKDKVVDLTNVAHGVLDAIDNGGRQEDDSDIVLRIMHQG